MNLRTQQLLKLHRLYAPAGEGGSDNGGTGTGEGEGTGAGEGGEGAGEGTGEGADAGEGGTGDGEGKPAAGMSEADAKLLKDLMKQKGRSAQLQKDLEAAKAALKNYEGVDPTKARALLAAEQEAERKAAEARGEYDRLIKQMGDRHAEDLARVNTELSTTKQQTTVLQQQIAELTVGNAFATSSFVANDLTLTPTKARVIYGAHFEYKDGAVVGYDKPAGASDRTVLVDAQGEALSFEDAMRKLVEADPDRESLLRTKAKPGAGSSSQSKGAKKAVDDAAARSGAKLSPAEKIAAGLKALAKS